MKLIEGAEATGKGEDGGTAVVCANCGEDFGELGGLLFSGTGQGRTGLCATCIDEAESLITEFDQSESG